MSTVTTLIYADEIVNQGIVKGAPLSSRFDASMIAPNISEAERRYLKTFIDATFFDDLVAAKNTDPCNYNTALGAIVEAFPNNPLYETLWTEYLFSYLSTAAVKESLNTVAFQIGSNGIFMNDTEFSKNAGVKGLTYLKDSMNETLKDLQPVIIKFLCDNKDDYPLFDSDKHCSSCNSEKPLGRNAGFVFLQK